MDKTLTMLNERSHAPKNTDCTITFYDVQKHTEIIYIDNLTMIVIAGGYLLGKNRTRKLLDYRTCSMSLLGW